MSLFSATVPQLTQVLRNIDSWLGKAEAHATAKKFDVNTLLLARLAPDQYPLVRQIHSACDAAKFLAARLSGKEAPAHPDTEQTIAELRARIASVIGYLGTFTEADFKDAATRKIPLGFMKGKAMLGANYANQFSIPNFYFHVAHTYAILRHNGVELGKMDYIGHVDMIDL